MKLRKQLLFILKTVATENNDWTLWECILFTKLYHKPIGTGQDKGNSQEETETFFDEQKSMHAQERTVSVIQLMS